MINGDVSRKISIVCEGAEEYDYICRLKELGVFNNIYSIKPKNAHGIDHVFQIYTSEFQSNNSEIVLVYCDTELYPYAKFETLKRKINTFHQKRSISNHVVFFGNPCTMQIMIMHFDFCRIRNTSKTENAAIIREKTGIKDYQAESSQRSALMRHMSIDNYEKMKLNISRLPSDYSMVSSTNFEDLLLKLENPDSSWIDDINKRII